MSARRPELTDKQENVLLLVHLGYSDDRIAEELAITRAGANYHIRVLREKFGVQRKWQLVPAARNYFLKQQITGER